MMTCMCLKVVCSCLSQKEDLDSLASTILYTPRMNQIWSLHHGHQSISCSLVFITSGYHAYTRVASGIVENHKG